MPNVNKVILIGHLTRDVETRAAGSSQVANFGLATTRKYKIKTGERQEETCFVDCTAWGKTGEVIAQYVGKGAPLYVEGYLKLDQWEDKDGSKRSKLKVVVESFQFLGGVKDKPTSGNPTAQSLRESVAEADIPF